MALQGFESLAGIQRVGVTQRSNVGHIQQLHGRIITATSQDVTVGTEVKAASNGAGLSRSSTQTAESTPEIRKAIPVQPEDNKPVEIRRAIPVKPLDQEDVNQTLLKSAAGPSGNLDE